MKTARRRSASYLLLACAPAFAGLGGGLVVAACEAADRGPSAEAVVSAAAALTGEDILASRHVQGLNDQHTGAFGFRELTGKAVDGNTGAYRAQLSSDGKVLVRLKAAPPTFAKPVWEVSATKHLATAVSLSGSDVTGVTLDSALNTGNNLDAPGSSPNFVDDNAGQSDVQVPFSGNQLAVVFNSLYATKGIPTEDPASCALDTPPVFSPKNTARYECLHLLVYARGTSELPAGPAEYRSCSASLYSGALCVMSAPLVVVLDHGTNPALDSAPAVMSAHLGMFRPIHQMGGTNGAAIRTGVNELAASGDGSLIFYVPTSALSDGTASPQSNLVIAYSYNPAPYLTLQASPYWASAGWTASQLLWDIYALASADPTAVRGRPNGFRRAYPMAQYPFRFANGVRIRNGMGRYQWFSPEGSDMFVNIGSRAVAAVLGRETRGIVKHVDSPAQLTNAVYCSICPATLPYTPNSAPMCSPGCDPLDLGLKNMGNPACSRNPGCSNNGFPRFGVQEYTSFGAASGFWAAAAVNDPLPVLPFLRRGPLRYMLFNNKALAFFNQDTAIRGQHMWVLGEVANDDFDDPHVLAAFHLNEAIFSAPKKLGCAFGSDAGTSRCDIEVDAPFTNPDATSSWTADTSRNSSLGQLLGGAQFPFDYWALKQIGERVQGNAEGTGEVNPGFRGRAVRFPVAGHIDVTTDDRGQLSAAKTGFTVELAIRPEVTTANYSGTLVQQAGSWQFGLTGGKLQLSSGAVTASAASAVTLTAGQWTHVAATVEPDPVFPNQLLVTFYVDGVAILPTSALPGLVSLPALASAASPKLCIGPGCAAGASSSAVWLDEVVLSDLARPVAYLAGSANATYQVPGFNASVSSSTWPTYIGIPGRDYDLIGNVVKDLKGSLLGLNPGQLRIPASVLNQIGGMKTNFTALRDLGRALFHDPLLSSFSTTSDRQRACSTCHAEAAGFTSPKHAHHPEPGLLDSAVPRHPRRRRARTDRRAHHQPG